MKVLLDTSVWVAGLVGAHPKHQPAFSWLEKSREKDTQLLIAVHSLAELYATLTALPISPKIAPVTARILIENITTDLATPVDLNAEGYLKTIVDLSARSLVGGIVYDALILEAAKRANVDYLVTFNGKHFKKLWTAHPEKILVPE